jgi:hypothetical protein
VWRGICHGTRRVGATIGRDQATGRRARHRTAPRSGLDLLHVQVLAIFVQAITAGLVVAGRPGAKPLHGTTATVTLLVGLLTLVAAILVWKPGGGSARFTVPSAILLVLLVVQSILGGNHVKAVHVPLGVALFGGVVVVALQAWSGPRARSGRS